MSKKNAAAYDGRHDMPRLGAIEIEYAGRPRTSRGGAGWYWQKLDGPHEGPHGPFKSSLEAYRDAARAEAT